MPIIFTTTRVLRGFEQVEVVCVLTRARRIVSSSHGSHNLHMSYVECCNLNNTGFSFYINVEVGRWSGLGHPLAVGLGPWHCAACRCDNLHNCKYHEEMRYCCFRGSWVPFGCRCQNEGKKLTNISASARLPFALRRMPIRTHCILYIDIYIYLYVNHLLLVLHNCHSDIKPPQSSPPNQGGIYNASHAHTAAHIAVICCVHVPSGIIRWKWNDNANDSKHLSVLYLQHLSFLSMCLLLDQCCWNMFYICVQNICRFYIYNI